jgi:hypothetical protein
MHMRDTIATFALATLVSAGTAFAQAQPPAASPEPRPAEQARPAQPPSQAPATQAAAPASLTAEGELVRVDPAAKTIVVRPEKGEQLTFKYTDVTIVSGTDAKIAGLATMAGTPVTVHYMKVEVAGEPPANVASRIEVRKK